MYYEYPYTESLTPEIALLLWFIYKCTVEIFAIEVNFLEFSLEEYLSPNNRYT